MRTISRIVLISVSSFAVVARSLGPNGFKAIPACWMFRIVVFCSYWIICQSYWASSVVVAAGVNFGSLFQSGSVSSQPLSVSATLQAWDTHPRGKKGDSASNISPMVPMHCSWS